MRRFSAAAVLPLLAAFACTSGRPAASPGSPEPSPLTVLSDTPYDVSPEVENPEDVRLAIRRAYPPLLRDAGIGGTVNLGLFLNESGEVEEVSLRNSSGQRALDDAALRLATVIRFTPALKDGEPVPIWVMYPIVFWSR